jgi:hypothetical protein
MFFDLPHDTQKKGIENLYTQRRSLLKKGISGVSYTSKSIYKASSSPISTPHHRIREGNLKMFSSNSADRFLFFAKRGNLK